VTVVWRSAARADIVRIIAHISEENPIAARHMARALVLAGDSLDVFPRRGRTGRVSGTRELAITFPYIIVYEVDDAEDVAILRVWHGAQDRD
jgi:plasmid stabilization system protein ParE